MTVVTFMLKEGLPAERQEATLHSVAELPSVTFVDRLDANSGTEFGFLTCYAQVSDAANAPTVLSKLRKMPGVESASIPALRYAV